MRVTACGGWGGASQKIKGSGVSGLAGTWRIISGGAGLVIILDSIWQESLSMVILFGTQFHRNPLN